MIFLWVKALHIMAVISWMAGLLYLPRLFVYHCQSNEPKIFETMEYKLLKYIMNPAMLVSIITGLTMAHLMNYWGDAWFLGKILAIILLIIAHIRMGWHRKQFARGANTYSARYFRFLNEAPTLLMIVIVIFVVLRIPNF